MRTAFLIIASLAASSAGAATLHMTFDNLNRMQGHLLVAVYNKPGDYDSHKHAVYSGKVPLDGRESPISLDIDLPAGRYAVEAMQDVNDNGKLDFNAMHIPDEPTGCSRNPRVWRRPHFDECAFDLPGTGRSITLDMY
ncbi:MAG: DUF2141 domain-containing protein [Rhodanobacteraceae bacterium]